MSTFKTGDTFYYFIIGRLLGVGAHGEVYDSAIARRATRSPSR